MPDCEVLSATAALDKQHGAIDDLAKITDLLQLHERTVAQSLPRRSPRHRRDGMPRPLSCRKQHGYARFKKNAKAA